MKLRINGNHIRLRLTRSEVAAIGQGESVEGRTAFVPSSLVYRLEACDAALPTVSFMNGVLRVVISSNAATNWATGDDVGIEADVQSAADQPTLHLLIEKDFRCLHGSVEEQQDCYPNPLEEESTPRDPAIVD